MDTVLSKEFVFMQIHANSCKTKDIQKELHVRWKSDMFPILWFQKFRAIEKKSYITGYLWHKIKTKGASRS